MLHQIKAPQFYTDLGLQKTVLNPLANGKIQGLLNAFECFSSTFQGKFNFQGLFKTILYSSTFQACANSVKIAAYFENVTCCEYYRPGYNP